MAIRCTIGIMATSSRVSTFGANLMKFKNEIFCESVNVMFATGRMIIASEGYHIFGCCHEFN